MDQEIGRIVAQLRAMKALNNTLILFMSDNGASAEKIVRGDKNDPKAAPGSAKSYLCLEPGWANLANTPLRLSKIFVHEGGISTPLIVHWPAGIRAHGELRRNPGHLIDLMPTILELAGTRMANFTSRGSHVPPPPGRSLVRTFAKDNTVSRDYLWWYHQGNRAVRVGDYKIVAEGSTTPWELYNMQTDRSEMHNLASIYPDKVKALAKVWQCHADEFQAAATSEDPPHQKLMTRAELEQAQTIQLARIRQARLQWLSAKARSSQPVRRP
jgi:arylsulfatase